MTRLAKNLTRDPNFLLSLGIAPEDATRIVDAMKAQGLFGDAYASKTKSPTQSRPTRAAGVGTAQSNSMRIRNLVQECGGIVDELSAAITLKDPVILGKTLSSIASKAEQSKEIQSGLVKAGICPVITEAARAMGASELVAENILTAVSLLCRYGDDRTTQSMDNILAFGEAGVADGIVLLLKTHGEDKVILSLACDVICHLTVVEVNRTRFGDAGAVEVLLRALLHCSMDSQFTAECAMITSALSYTSFKHAGNRARLAEAESRVAAMMA